MSSVVEGAAASGNGRLVANLYERHMSALQGFRTEVREACQQIDVEALHAMTDLRSALLVSRTESETMLDEIAQMIDKGRATWSSEAERFAQRTADDPVVRECLVDVFHQHGVHSYKHRDEAILEQRHRLMRMYARLRVLHQERMSLIDHTATFLRDAESRRRGRLCHLMETLMHDLSVIAYTGVTESQVVVQRAAASVNEQLIANQRTCKTLISQLLQHELLKQRDYAERAAHLYKSLLQWAQDSSILWLQQLLASKTFRAPQSRTAMLHRIQAALAKTKGEVRHALQGLSSVVETLRRVRDSPALEVCGGTEANGWLRYFDDDRFHPVFSESPTVVAEEWKVFLDVIIHNAECSVVTLTEDTATIESQLLAEVRNLCDGLLETLERLYTPTDEEIACIREGSLDGENLYPFHNAIHVNVGAIQDAKRLASERLQSIRNEIVDESGWLQKTIRQQLVIQKTSLEFVLASGSGNVTKTFLDATVALKGATERPHTQLRKFYTTQHDNEKDYQDQLSWLERDLADVTDRLQHAGTVEIARQLCIRGMKILEDIERLYVRYHKQRVSPMTSSVKELDDTLECEAKDLQGKLNVVAKNDGKKPQAEAQPTKMSRKSSKLSLQGSLAFNNDDAQMLVLDDGTAFTICGPMKFGLEDPKQAAPSGDADVNGGAGQSPSAADAASKGGKPPPGGKPSPKAAPAGKGAASSASGDATAEASGSDGSLATATVPPSATLKFFIGRMGPLFDEVFAQGHEMYPEGDIVALKTALRLNILEWCVQLRVRANRSITTYCDETKKVLDREMNAAIRRHQRRAPTLQAQTYESRVRELSDGLNSRAKYFEWLQRRVDMMQQAFEASKELVSQEFAASLLSLQDAAATLKLVMSSAALDSHGRQMAERIKAALAASKTRQEEALKQLHNAAASITQECTQYQSEKLKSFDQGGTMSEDEVKASTEQIRAIVETSERTVQSCVAAMESTATRQVAELEQLRAAYDIERKRSNAEFAFFTEMQELFAQLKGKVSNQITLSLNAQRHLDDVLESVERTVGQHCAKRDAAALQKLLGYNYELPPEKLVEQHPGVTVPEDWSGCDEALSARLMKTQLATAMQLRQCTPAQLFALLDDLRQSLYLRGQFLGCLAWGVDYAPIAPDTYLEPRRESSAAAAPSGSPADGKGKANPGKGKAAASPVAAKGAAAAAAPTSSGDGSSSDRAVAGPPKALRADVEVARWSAAIREQLNACVAAYFSKTHASLVRSSVLGESQADVLRTIEERCTEQEQKSAVHVVEATRKYREQVARTFVATHGCASCIFNGLYNVSLESLELRLSDALYVFNGYYGNMQVCKFRNSQLVKSSLSLPSNRGALEELAASERSRRLACNGLLQSFQYVSLREIEAEAGRVAGRVCHALGTHFLLMRGMVSPDHLVPGEDVVTGEHKGLKRLLRQRMREEAAKQIDASPSKTAGKGGAAPPAKPAAPEPKKPTDKPGAKGPPGGGKGAKDGGASATDDDLQLVPLEKANVTDFSGVVTNAVRVLTKFRAERPNVPVPPNHYLSPAQWEADRRAQQQAAEAEAAQAQAEAAKKPSGKAAAAKPAAKGAGAALPTSPSPTGGAEDEVSMPLSGPRDRLHQQAVLLRQNTLDAFNSVCTHVGADALALFDHLDVLEATWATSWEEALSGLRTELLKQK